MPGGQSNLYPTVAHFADLLGAGDSSQQRFLHRPQRMLPCCRFRLVCLRRDSLTTDCENAVTKSPAQSDCLGSLSEAAASQKDVTRLQGGLFFREGGNNAALYPEPKCPRKQLGVVPAVNPSFKHGQSALSVCSFSAPKSSAITILTLSRDRFCERPGTCITRTRTRCVSCAGTAAPSSVPVALTGHHLIVQPARVSFCSSLRSVEVWPWRRIRRPGGCDVHIVEQSARDSTYVQLHVLMSDWDPHGSNLLQAEERI